MNILMKNFYETKQIMFIDTIYLETIFSFLILV